MKLKDREFHPSWRATLAMACGVALTVFLGFWQLGRADTKQALQIRLEEFARQPPVVIGADTLHTDDVLLRHVAARGRFEPRHTVYIDNRLYKHQPGYYVYMPLRIHGTDKYVLVNRGWIAATAERNRAPPVKTPEADVVVHGIATPPSERFLELSSKIADGNIWQNMVLERYRQATHLDVQPFILQQSEQAGSLNDGLIRDWPPLNLKRNTHLAYAVQWFALAAAIFIYYVVINVRRKPDSATG